MLFQHVKLQKKRDTVKLLKAKKQKITNIMDMPFKLLLSINNQDIKSYSTPIMFWT